MNILKIKNFTIGNHEPMTLMAGVNVLESESVVMAVAEKFAETTSSLNINWIFKGSFDKANRSSISSFRGPGIDEGLKMLEKVKSEFDAPVITDIHEPSQADIVSKICDVIQIPAFLCRQTDLVIAAAKTKKIIQFKKPQFLSAPEMKNVIEKCNQAGNNNVTLCERGNSYGYNNLVVDMLNFQIMKDLDVPVIFDATHSVQQPGGQGETSGGQREFVEYLARAAVAVGVAGVFIETHQDPDNAPSDGPNMVPLNKLENLLKQLHDIDNLIKK